MLTLSRSRANHSTSPPLLARLRVTPSSRWLGHGVFQIEKLAIADQVLSVGLREFLFWIVEASLRHLGCELGSDRVPVGIDDCPVFGSVSIGIEANWRCALFAANRLNNIHSDLLLLPDNL